MKSFDVTPLTCETLLISTFEVQALNEETICVGEINKLSVQTELTYCIP